MYDVAPMYDVTIVGLGAMGAAVAWHASRLGLSVLGLDRYEPPHTHGSTHAETRITRLAVGEGDHYIPFVARSHALWRELETLTGTSLLHQSGGYILTDAAEEADRWTDFTMETARIAERAGVGYEVFDAAAMRERQPGIVVPDGAKVGFEPTAGIVMCERAVAAQLAQAREAGAQTRFGEDVTAIEPFGDHVQVTTSESVYAARHVVVAAGPWTPELVPSTIADRLSVTRQVVHWFEADDLDAWSVDTFPFVMWIAGTIDDYVAAFPTPPDSAIRGVKVLGEQFDATTTPEQVERRVSAEEIADFHRRLVAPRFPGITDRSLRAEVCLYTNTPDDHFLIEADPRSDRIVVMSPCSGHGFKHSTALGEAIAQRLATGGSDLSLEPFGLAS